MKLSTRNVIKGKVLEVKEGMVVANVKLDIGNGNVITSLISMESVKDLNIKPGEQVLALIKATSVMLAKE